MTTYDIVVLDTGVEIEHNALSCYDDIDCKYLLESGEEAIADGTDITGHGTAVTWLIKKRLPKASILSLKIYDMIDEKVVCSEERLISALNFIEANYKVKVINLSSSISAPKRMKELKEVTARLADKGVVIVSPHHNNHSLSYPAAFEWVLGVAVDTHLIRGQQKIATTDSVINIIDSIKQHQVPWKDNQYVLKSGGSFSCPDVSAITCSYLKHGAKNIYEVLECLRKDLFCETSLASIPKKPKFSIKKAVAFPFNKEMHSVIRFSDQLSFELIDVYDLKHSLNIGRSTREILLDDNTPEYIVKNVDYIEWDTFDTLILGCVKELFSVFKDYSHLNKIINLAIKNNKNIYSFEDLYTFADINDLKDRLFYPEVGVEQLTPYREGRLAKTSTAIVGIFGTSSKQGKFTLQMELRKELIKRGCKVGQIGTEPSALLFGMDYIFPMGYNSTVYIRENEKILYCNDLIRKLSESCPDIIIVGSQRETIPKSFENIYQLCTSTYAFLQGTKPDYAIIMISIEDEDNYILRTVNFLDSITETRTVAFVVSPLTSLDNNEPQVSQKRKITQTEYLNFKDHIEKTFKTPVFLLGEYNLATKLLETVLKNLNN